MTDHQPPSRSGLGILVGTFLPAMVGALIGWLMSINSWPRPEGLGSFSSFAWASFIGVMIGGFPLLVSGFVLAWHGGSLSVSEDAAESAPLWGIIVGGLVRASLAPLLGLFCGVLGNQITAATLFALYAGPIAGIISWEISYFAPRVLRI